jgi:hypothetical protein
MGLFLRPANMGGGRTDTLQTEIARLGTLDWLFAEYRADRRYTGSRPAYQAQP